MSINSFLIHVFSSFFLKFLLKRSPFCRPLVPSVSDFGYPHPWVFKARVDDSQSFIFGNRDFVQTLSLNENTKMLYRSSRITRTPREIGKSLSYKKFDLTKSTQYHPKLQINYFFFCFWLIWHCHNEPI